MLFVLNYIFLFMLYKLDCYALQTTTSTMFLQSAIFINTHSDDVITLLESEIIPMAILIVVH